MGNNTAFAQQGNTASLQTSASPNTGATPYQVTPANLGLTNMPTQCRMVNNGTADVWLVITDNPSMAAAVFPTVSAGAVGTPQPGYRLKPGIVEVFTTPGGPTWWISDISPSASQQYDITPGEGL